MRCQKLEGTASRPGPTWKFKQEPGSSPSWTGSTRMDLNPGRAAFGWRTIVRSIWMAWNF